MMLSILADQAALMSPITNNSSIRLHRNLIVSHPEILKEWDFSKNIVLPENLSPGSVTKVWWLCPKQHSWLCSVSDKIKRKFKCYVCSKRRIPRKIHPLLEPDLRFWDYKKNLADPRLYSKRCYDRVDWICPMGHAWISSIRYQVSNNKCPECSRIVNSLW
jgi:hypothetical protein